MKIKIAIIGALFVATPLFAFADSSIQEVQIKKVKKVVYNDRANEIAYVKSGVLRAQIGEEEKDVELIGVDLEREGYSSCVWGRSTRALHAELNDVDVTLVSDPEVQEGSQRLRRYIRLPEGKTLNEYLIREGYYYVDHSDNFTEKERYIELEKDAEREGKGVWGGRLECEVQSFLELRDTDSGEKFIGNISVYQILQFISLSLLLLILVLMWHFWTRGRK